MFILKKKGHQPGVNVPLRALFLVFLYVLFSKSALSCIMNYEKYQNCCILCSLTSDL